jgi:hypothetical protein
MSSFLTIGDYLAALAGNDAPSAAQSVEPTLEELNAGGVAPFITPSDSAIASLKQLLSYEAWLYMMGANQLGIAYNHRLGERETQQHLVRSIALLDFKDKNLPLNAPAVQARVRWLQRRVLNLGGDATPKPYYQLMAEGQIKQAKQQAASDALWHSLSLDERHRRLRERWGDLPLAVLEEREQQAARQQKGMESLVVTSRRAWNLAIGPIDHPAFEPWFIEEVLRLEPLEVDAYLTVMWRIGDANLPTPLGDTRQNISLEQIPNFLKLLKPAISDAIGKPQRALKYARKWFKEQLQSSSIIAADTPVNKPNQATLTHRQIALREFYRGRTIQNDARAKKLAEENNLTSGEVLTKQYRKISKEGGITDVGKNGLNDMIADLLRVRDELNKDEIYKLDIQLRMLKNKSLRTGPD